MKAMLRLLARGLRGALLALAAVVLFIEEWGWRPLTAWASRLARWPPLARLEARIRAVSPRMALVLFLVPALLLFPVKLFALWLIQRGQAALGILVIVAVKLLGTGFVGRLFIITEAQLMTFGWFARGLAWWRATKLRVKAALLRSAGWQSWLRWRRGASAWWRRRARKLRRL